MLMRRLKTVYNERKYALQRADRFLHVTARIYTYINCVHDAQILIPLPRYPTRATNREL